MHFGLNGANLTFRDPPRQSSLDSNYACLLPERDIVAPPVNHMAFPRPISGGNGSHTSILYKVRPGDWEPDLHPLQGETRAIISTLNLIHFRCGLSLLPNP